MNVVTPPRAARLKFWLLGLRLAPEFRGWVAQQIMAKGYFWRVQLRTLAVVLLTQATAFVALESSAFSGVSVLPGAIGALIGLSLASVLVNRDRLRQRWLAYHRTTEDGAEYVPDSQWSPWSRYTFALLTVQMLVLVSAITVLAADYVRTRNCEDLRPADAAALASAIGQPGFGPQEPPPLVPPGTPLIAAQSVDAEAFPGIRYAAAYVRDGSGKLRGPAAWRFIDPGALGPSEVLDVGASSPLAARITPSLGRNSSTPEQPAVIQARACAKAALD